MSREGEMLGFCPYTLRDHYQACETLENNLCCNFKHATLRCATLPLHAMFNEAPNFKVDILIIPLPAPQ